MNGAEQPMGAVHPAPPAREDRRPRGGAPLIVNAGLYMAGKRRQSIELADLDQAMKIAERTDAFVWIGLWEPTAEEFAQIAETFGLSPLAVEDALTAHQRPKIERYHGSTFAVVKPVHYIDPIEAVEVGEMAVFLGDNFVITVRHGESTVPSRVRARLEQDPEMLNSGPIAVLYTVLDTIVDDYLDVLEAITVDIEDIEYQVFSDVEGDYAKRIYAMKREVLEFRRAAAPLITPMQRLMSSDIPGMSMTLRQHFRDVLDHVLRVSDALDSFDNLLTGVLQAHMTQISMQQNAVAMQQNADMRKISAWAAIGILPTTIGAIYGMNFEHMPELKWKYGYFLVIGFMLTACVLLYTAFRRNKWL